MVLVNGMVNEFRTVVWVCYVVNTPHPPFLLPQSKHT